MERLTEYEIIAGHAHAVPTDNMDKVMMRLAAYEDLMERWKLRSIEEADRIFQCVNALGGTDLMAQYRAIGSIYHLRDLIQAEQDGRLMVLPFPQNKSLLDMSNPENPELLVNFRVAIAYNHCGIVFHQPFNIFMENVERGYICQVSEDAEAHRSRKGK